MINKNSKKFSLTIFIFISFYLLLKINWNSDGLNCDKSLVSMPQKLVLLSKQLTENTKKLGQLSCQLSKNQVSENGGWCSKISGKKSPQHVTDFKMAKYLSHFLSGKSVASFGDGPGIYKEIFLNLSNVKSYDAFDGAPFCEETTNNQVVFLDLTIPIYHLKVFDWVLSIEVAEHIPDVFEDIYIDNLVRHAKEGIVISWATPGQGGLSHINEKSFIKVKEIFENFNFLHLEKQSKELKNVSELPWLRKNLNIFKRKV